MWQEKLLTLWSTNKLPLVLAAIGLLLVLFGIFSMVKSENLEESGVILEEAASTENSKQREIVVDVSGAVIKPGVYKLAADARLGDALIAAGGLSQDANREYVAKSLNLAVKLPDGAKVYIPNKTQNSPFDSAQGKNVKTQNYGEIIGVTGSGIININTASLSELDKLPGVGPVTAQKIVDNRPYSSVDELLSKKVVGSKVFGEIKEKTTTY